DLRRLREALVDQQPGEVLEVADLEARVEQADPALRAVRQRARGERATRVAEAAVADVQHGVAAQRQLVRGGQPRGLVRVEGLLRPAVAVQDQDERRGPVRLRQRDVRVDRPAVEGRYAGGDGTL